jgi:hypothetical protein
MMSAGTPAADNHENTSHPLAWTYLVWTFLPARDSRQQQMRS